jgi:hypothetical protein
MPLGAKVATVVPRLGSRLTHSRALPTSEEFMSSPPSAWSRADKINAFLASVALVTAIAAIWPLASQFLESRNAAAASIDKPGTNSRISGKTTTANGTARNVAPDESVWLVLRTSADGNWYPSQRLDIQPDGTWETSPTDPVVLADTGQFELYLYKQAEQRMAALQIT